MAWAIVFARAGHEVRVFEPDEPRRGAIAAEVEGRVTDLVAAGLQVETPAEVASRVIVTPSLRDAVHDAGHVQECAPESVEVKRQIFVELDDLVDPPASLASSSSAIPCSSFASDLAGRSRCLVVHPGNPPHLLPIAEVVPAPFTADTVVDSVVALLAEVGMQPIVVRKEIEGFVFNRLQGALLREAYCLVRDGVASASEIDAVVTEGLGRRWAVVGPFATAALNTRGGVAAHARRLGPAYARMGLERGQDDPWTEDLVDRVAAELEASLPLDRWDDLVRSRDLALMAIEGARRSVEPASDPDLP